MQLKSLVNSQKTIENGTPLNGVFEVHVTVDPEENYVKFIDYCDRNKSHSMKIVYAVSTKKNNQYMLSYFTRKEDDKDVVAGALKVAKEIQSLGIRVVRVKVEGHGLQNTPMTNKDYELTAKYLTAKYEGQAGHQYFEFHVKINPHLGGSKEIESAISQYGGTAISYNLCSANRKALLTVRVYDQGFIEAQVYKDTVMNTLKDLGYSFEDKIHQEFCIYDNNCDLDKGWLI
jgi:hypothetical protein